MQDIKARNTARGKRPHSGENFTGLKLKKPINQR